MHGNLTQTQRLTALENFKNGLVDVLLCTDLAARGLDVKGVNAVVNFEMPKVETYVHRVGRTARAGCGGLACTLISEGRRHLMKEVMKDAVGKNEGKKGSAIGKKTATNRRAGNKLNIESQNHRNAILTRYGQSFMHFSLRSSQ